MNSGDGAFVGKSVTLSYRETRVVELSGEIVSDTPEGITIRHTYRKGKRLEFIPRDTLQGLFLDEEKRSRKPSSPKVAKADKPVAAEPKETKPVVEEEDKGVDKTLSEVEDFDDGDEDGFEDDDDEFE